MREAEIIEGNSLIAQFMGKTVYPLEGTKEYKKWKGEAHDYNWFQLKYNESWDWLYPVVQKIAKYMIDTDFGSERKLSVALNWWKHIANALEKASDIEVIHKHVVQFIKWYNLQTNQP